MAIPLASKCILYGYVFIKSDRRKHPWQGIKIDPLPRVENSTFAAPQAAAFAVCPSSRPSEGFLYSKFSERLMYVFLAGDAVSTKRECTSDVA